MEMDLVVALKSLGLGVLSLVGVLLGLLAQYLKRKSKHTWLDALIGKAHGAAWVAVEFVGQTYSDELKDTNADGRLSNKEAKEAFTRALARAKSQLGPKLWAELVKGFGLEGAESIVSSAVEVAVAERGDKPRNP